METEGHVTSFQKTCTHCYGGQWVQGSEGVSVQGCCEEQAEEDIEHEAGTREHQQPDKRSLEVELRGDQADEEHDDANEGEDDGHGGIPISEG